jgi:hypothetical protein
MKKFVKISRHKNFLLTRIDATVSKTLTELSKKSLSFFLSVTQLSESFIKNITEPLSLSNNLSKVVHIYDVERGWSGANEHYTQQNSNI